MRKSNAISVALVVAHLTTILAANWAVAHIGPVPVGLGLVAPAGVYFIGLGLVLRDQIHERLGVRITLGVVLAGCALSVLVAGPQLALASGASFLLAELLDLAVYIPSRRRLGVAAGVLLSGLVGSLVDSYVFLSLAFGSLAFFPGQVAGKLAMTAVGALVILGLRRMRLA